jgi:alkanesulfonate monooxygenase SsuD/methylene tetrahydromethanopterin reductase-like flavin-dependent oxidoreductase (luciferase family)
MQFGFYITAYYTGAEADSWTDLYAGGLEQARVAEELGFTSVSIPEHHFNNYLTIPSPLALASAVAQHTKTVDIVTAVLVLPFYDPRRLAGEIAMADHLTGGRLHLGLGRGAFRYEFGRFGHPWPVDEVKARFNELVPLLDRLLTEEEVTHDGEYYGFSQPLTIMPRTAQAPRPPFYVAAISESGIRWAVEHDYNLQTTPLRAPFELTAKQAQWFLNARDARPAGSPPLVHHMLRNVYVSKDRRDIAEKSEMLRENHRRFVNLFESDGDVRGGWTEPMDVEMSAAEAAHNVLVGDPDEVIERLQAHADLGIDAIQVNMSFGARQEDILRSMQLFAEEVMPAIGADAPPIAVAT